MLALLKQFAPMIGLCLDLGLAGSALAAAAPVPIEKDFDDETVDVDVQGTHANTTGLSYVTHHQTGGWSVADGKLVIDVNDGQPPALGDDGGASGAALIEIEDNLNAVGFVAKTDLVFPDNRKWASTGSQVRLVVNADDDPEEFEANVGGYQLVIERGTGWADDATMQIEVGDVPVDSVTFGKPVGATLTLTLQGVPDTSGGLNLTAKLDDGTDAYNLTHTVAADDLQTGAFSGYAYDLFTNNDLKAELDNLSIKALPEADARDTLLYSNPLAEENDVQGWVMEGPGRIEFQDNWMSMDSPEEAGHHVFWCPKVFPDNFVARWQVQHLEDDHGLCIVFFAAMGSDGGSIFDDGLPPRDGDFQQYVNGAIRNYHVSYYANTPWNPDRGTANLRRNPGMHLLQEGEAGIPTASRSIHTITLVKDGGHIRLWVDDRKVVDHRDDSDHGPPLAQGHIGLRQMKWSHFRYRDFKVWGLK